MMNVACPHPSSRRDSSPLAAVPVALALAAIFSSAPAGAAPIKVAVIGPQHVHSHQLTRDKEYPAMLQTLLGPNFMVGNFGDCCATILQGYPKQGETHPYLESGEAYKAVGGMNFKDSVKFMPDIVVIGPWGKHDTEIADQLYKGMLDRTKLEADFDELVTTYQKLPTKPQVIVLTPIPIPFGMPVGVTTGVLLPAIKAVAEKYKLPVVDVYPAFLNHKELFKDETHITNDTGLHTLADMVFAVMKANPPGSVPAPADASAPSEGTADAGASGGSSGAGGTGAGGNSGTGGAAAGGAGSGSGGSGAATGGSSGAAGAGSGGSAGGAGAGGSGAGGAGAGALQSGGASAGSGETPAAGCDVGGRDATGTAAGSLAGLLAAAGLTLVTRRRRRSRGA